MKKPSLTGLSRLTYPIVALVALVILLATVPSMIAGTGECMKKPSLTGLSRLTYPIIALVALVILLATVPSMIAGTRTPPPLSQPPVAAQAPSTPAPLGQPPMSARPLSTPTPRIAGSPVPTSPPPAASDIDSPAVDQPPAGEATPTMKTESAGEWRLVFLDEFDGPTLDTSKWTPSFWWGSTHTEKELQAYSPDNLELTNGILRLRADRRSSEGFPYTSGMISSHGKFNQEYGLFEMRARIPKGMGLWAAFWLAPDKRSGVTWPPEIDVMETRGSDTELVSVTHHYIDQDGKHAQQNGHHLGPDLSADFHVFAVEWDPGVSIWYLDGVEVWRSPTPLARGRMYLIANLAVGDWAGNPNSSTPFPSYFDIDYIRVFQR